jgi:hypothetical protein
MFGRKLTSDEYEKLLRKIVACVGDIDEVKQKIEVLRTNQNSLRGLVNRKMGKIEDDEVTEENLKYKEFLG